eukprot:CAMPEP_0201592754 /NCGR_PEP_ID=MMETSP0190_2-20130828/190558_1 /ASSEMBLY_ACC=CAM_ASM_000263 /TAXON_ID=37353 /ORGANISM="Rosalina sp." /LENGTH=567 /DNA_ID=CAMNT_0048051663 /DNA_START=38 /DNA_END=1739 /DNA_ORIENTATION=-
MIRKKKDKKKSGKKGKDADSQTISLKDGWDRIFKVGVQPFFERVENVDDPDQMKKTSIPQQQYILAYDTIFTMCIQREPYNYSSPLYQKHSEALTKYFKEKAVPALKKAKEQHGLIYLKEWVKRWRCNKWAVDGMTRMFMYLDRFHVPNSEDLLTTSEQGYHYIDKMYLNNLKILAYDTIFTMCIQREPYNYSSPLYQKHSEALTKYFKEKAVPALRKAKEQHGLIYLKEWVKRWRCNKWAVDGMTRMFMYLDRFHVPNSEDLLTTSEQGYTLYRQNVFEQFKDNARQSILTCITRERDGEEQDRDLLRDSILVYVELGNKLKKVELQIYKEDFHKNLVQETKQYYKQKSRFWLDQQTCPEYLIQAEKCVTDEEGRLQSYIDKYSKDGLMTATRDEILKHHQEELMKKATGIDSMLARTVGADADAAKEDLARLYRLYSQVPGGNGKIAEAIKIYVCQLGNGFIQKSKEAKGQEKTDHALITSLIDLHDRFLKIVNNQFAKEAIFQKALKEAFEEFINKEYYTSALLARFANDILKKGTKVSTADLENTFDHVVMLYGYIRDKDIFE